MKRLITAAVVRQECQAGTKRLEVSLPECIVTPEARLVAEQVGMQLVETVTPRAAKKASAKPGAPVPPATPTAGDLAAIRAAVLAKLPQGSVPESVVTQLIQKALKQGDSPAAEAAPEASFRSSTAPSGIKLIDGASVRMGIFDGAGRENRVGIVDVVTAEDGSSMAAGFMAWEKCFFPWTLTYDEIDLVLEGELHIRCNGTTTIGKAGDVIFIPKNTSIEFGTPTSVKFLYVACPANWQEI